MKKINIIGLGYVGLTLAIALAEKKFKVNGIEKDKAVLKTLNAGKAHFFEPNLDNLLVSTIKDQSLKILSKIPKATKPEVYIITVGTPINSKSKVDIKAIKEVTKEIKENCKSGSLIIARSTMRIGTTEKIIYKTFEKSKRKKVHIAVCPERTIEGKALKELHQIPQIIGSPDKIAQEMAQEIFLNLAPSFSIVSSWEGAEIIKLMDNTYRDIQFAVANEFAMIIEGIGENANQIFETANSGYARTNIPKPGLVGGPCLEKDPHILIESAKNFNINLPITHASRKINEDMVNVGLSRVFKILKKKKVYPKKISIFGLSFKGNPDTSDIRGSLALKIINALQKKYKNSQIIGFDKNVYENDVRNMNIKLERDPYAASENADLIVIQHNSDYIKNLNITKIVNLMNYDGIIYDYWTLFDSYRKKSKKNIDYIAYGNGK